MHQYLSEFLTLAVVHLLAVASPGPDFAIILRQSVSHGRKVGVWTGIGIGCGVMVHVIYCLLGLGLIISQSILAFNIVKFLGAGYLIFIGFQAIRAKKLASNQPLSEQKIDYKLTAPSAFQAFSSGFITNVLNPKATLFFLALFSVVINPATPAWIQFAYGLWMLVVTAAWFSGLSLIFSLQQFRKLFQSFGHWFERTMGAVLIALGIKLAFTTQK